MNPEHLCSPHHPSLSTSPSPKPCDSPHGGWGCPPALEMEVCPAFRLAPPVTAWFCKAFHDTVLVPRSALWGWGATSPGPSSPPAPLQSPAAGARCSELPHPGEQLGEARQWGQKGRSSPSLVSCPAAPVLSWRGWCFASSWRGCPRSHRR